MKLIDFKISNDNIAIETADGRYFDLGNNFELKEFRYDFKERNFKLLWTKSVGDWVKEDEADSIKLNFTNVSFLKLRELDQEGINEFKDDDLTLNMIGYSPIEGSDMESYLAIEEDSKGENAIIIQTQNGQAILIFSEYVTLQTK